MNDFYLILGSEAALADRALYKGKEAGRNRGYIVAGLRRPEGGLELDLVLPGVAG
mgnify:CR=1 FL=1